MISNSSDSDLRGIRYGKNNWRLPQPFIENIQALAANSVAYKTGDGAGYVVQSLTRTISQFQQEIDCLKRQLSELYQQTTETGSLLATIPGISPETAIVLEAYIGDVGRFANAKKFVAYFGMNPTVNMSGKHIGKSYLQKKGAAIIRHKLFMSTLCMIGREIEPIFSFYQRLIDAGKPKLVAIAACMRKLLVIIYYMLKNKQPFSFQSKK
jgi:transposase